MKAKIQNLTIRYILFFAGLSIMACGVALSAKSDLGVSPISSIPYVVSLMTGFTIGELTAIMNTVLFALQLVLLRSRFPKVQWLQLPVGILFGYLIDLSLYLLAPWHPQSYAGQCGWCVSSFLLLGFGVFCEVKADVTMLCGEGLVSAITTVTGSRFARNKMLVDSALVLLAVAISFAYFASLRGVREGTIGAALAVGFFAGLFLKKITVLDRHVQAQSV